MPHDRRLSAPKREVEKEAATPPIFPPPSKLGASLAGGKMFLKTETNKKGVTYEYV